PGAGCGASTSSSRRTCGPPNWCTRTAFIALVYFRPAQFPILPLFDFLILTSAFFVFVDRGQPPRSLPESISPECFRHLQGARSEFSHLTTHVACTSR